MKSSDDYGDFDIYNSDVKNYFKASHTFRLGAEYRLSPNFSVRAGYSYVSSAVQDVVKSSDITVYNESSCNPSYTLDNSTNYGTFGLGYRSGGFYLDLAYVYKHTSATYRAFGSFNEYTNYWEDAPSASVKLNSNNLVLTLGYKF
jgi:opacity protein-like surface antigen